MIDLDQRAARILESLTCDRCPACDNKYGTTPDQQWYCEGCGERWETSNESADLIREQAAEIERLNAAIRKQANAVRTHQSAERQIAADDLKAAQKLRAETSPDALESERAANAVLTGEVQRLQARIDALMLEHCPDEMTPEQIAEWEKHQVPVRDAGPTPLRGRITRRT